MNTPTQQESLEALVNDWKDLCMAFNPDIVSLQREQAPEGAMLLVKVTVHAPSYEIVDGGDDTPQRVEQQDFRLLVYNGYPAVKPKVYFGPKSRNASVNCFQSKTQCTDEWGPYSSLLTLVEKTVKDIIHDPSVTRYNSMAYGALEHWQREMTSKGILPTIPPERIYFRKTPVLPSLPKKTAVSVKPVQKTVSPPPLPVRQ